MQLESESLPHYACAINQHIQVVVCPTVSMKQSTKILSALVVLIALVLLYVLNPVSPTPTGPQSAILYRPGVLGSTSEKLSVTDHTRTTMANGRFDGQPFRELEGKLSFPENREHGPYPLILYSHGFMSSVREANYLVEFLVPKGYVIVAVNSPLSSWRSPGGPTINDVLNQPGDISFVMDALLARNNTEGDSLYGLIDPDRIAAVGLSLGGLTSQLVAFHRDNRDPRIAAVVSIAGPTAFLTTEFFRTSPMPFMMIAGSEDAIIPYEAHAAPIPIKAPQAMLVTLQGGTHFGFARFAESFLRWFRHPDQVACPILLGGLQNGDQLQAQPLSPDAAIGISSEVVAPCTMTEYKRAMRPVKQRMLTQLAVYAFLESVFARESDRRAQMERFLLLDLPQEEPSVSL
ncbi:MAG: hypothetical protein Q8K97_16070 [Pseudohongiella sp.]|nr:hypothetical protein [Pseudohongiella sp.]